MFKKLKNWWHRHCVKSQLRSFVGTMKLCIAKAELNKVYGERDKILKHSGASYKIQKAETAIAEGKEAIEWVRLFNIAYEPTMSEVDRFEAKTTLRYNACNLVSLLGDCEMGCEDFSKARHEILNMFLKFEKEGK